MNGEAVNFFWLNLEGEFAPNSLCHFPCKVRWQNAILADGLCCQIEQNFFVHLKNNLCGDGVDLVEHFEKFSGGHGFEYLFACFAGEGFH